MLLIKQQKANYEGLRFIFNRCYFYGCMIAVHAKSLHCTIWFVTTSNICLQNVQSSSAIINPQTFFYNICIFYELILFNNNNRAPSRKTCSNFSTNQGRSTLAQTFFAYIQRPKQRSGTIFSSAMNYQV